MAKLRKLTDELSKALETADERKGDIKWALEQFEKMPKLELVLSRALSICSWNYVIRLIEVLNIKKKI